MAPPSPWLDQVDDLVRAVQRSTAPVWFNADVQELLGIGRRQASRLMRRWGAAQHGHDYELTSALLVAGLRDAAARAGARRPGRPTEWLLRLPGAFEQVEALPAGTILLVRDLARVFRISRARAAELAAAWGSTRVGRRLEVTREVLLEAFRKVLDSLPLEAALERRRRLQKGLEAQRLLVPLTRGRRTVVRVARLPSNVHLSPGRLEITGSTPKELLAGLVAVAEALAADPLGFEETQRGWTDSLVPPEGMRVERAAGESRTAQDLGFAARRVLGPTSKE